MYTIFSGLLVWLLVQSCFSADNKQIVFSAVELENRQLVLIHSIYNNDIGRMRAILAAGAKPKQGMLVKCRTVAQARMLVEHGLSIKKENELYGFLPERIMHEADPDLLIYFLEQIPLSIANRYGREVYRRLLCGITEVALGNVTKNELRFCQKLQILMDHNCYYDHKWIMGNIEIYNDSALNNDRDGVKKMFESIIIDNEPKKRTNMLPLLQQRARTGLYSFNGGQRYFQLKKIAYTNLQERYAQKIRQYEGKRSLEAIEKGLNGFEYDLYVREDFEFKSKQNS